MIPVQFVAERSDLTQALGRPFRFWHLFADLSQLRFIQDNPRFDADGCLDLRICRENGAVERRDWLAKGRADCMQIGFVYVFSGMA